MDILVLGYKEMLGNDLAVRLMGCHGVTGKDMDDFDISSEAACRNVISETNPDVVIYAAAYTDVDCCESDKDKCFSVNAEGVKNVALACQERGVKMVHFSTNHVFDGQKRSPYVEDDPCNPVNLYGQSKLMGERYLREISKNYILVRSSCLYGRNEKNYVKTIVEKARTEKCIEAVDDQISSPTFTWDLAAAVQILIESHHTGVFHVTNRGSCSWYEFTLRIIKCTGMTDVHVNPIGSDKLAGSAHRPPYSVLSCRKFIETTRKTMRYWQVALDDFIGKMGY
jgi:dTDP-4-dehydrorhamnose reductase